MDSQKEHLHEEAQTASSATYTTVNNIYGLAFQHCTFHDATFQTLVQGAEGEREKKAKMAEAENEKETPVTSLFSIENAKELLAKFQHDNLCFGIQPAQARRRFHTGGHPTDDYYTFTHNVTSKNEFNVILLL